MNTARTRFGRRRIALAGLAAVSLLAAACGDDDDTAASEPDTSSPASGAPSSEGPAGGVDFAELSGELIGSGATFPKGFYDEAIAELAGIAPDLVVEYGGGGSGKGRSDLQEQLVDFAGTDSIVKDEDKAKYKGGEFVYVPTVIAPITLSYNLPGVDELHLSPATIAGIFQLEITKWNDPAIAADNAGVTLPNENITVARRADGSGTTDNFSKFLDAAVGPDATGEWKLGSGSELEWPAGTQAGDGNSGVAQIVKDTEGAIGYVDLSDAKANDLTFAAVQNKAGEFVLPTVEATQAAAEGAEIADDLTFFLGWAEGAESYPIAAQTWIIVYLDQADAEQAETLKGFLTFLLTDAQQLAADLDYAPLPESLQEQALENIASIG